MKKISALVASILIANTAYADTCAKTLMPLFTAAQAKELCSVYATAFGSSIVPQTDNVYDLGSSTLEFKDGFFDGTLRTDALTMDGDIAFSASGNTIAIQEATAGAACSGSLTFNGTTPVVVSTTCAVTGARIFFTPTSDPTGSTAAYCWVSAISNGVSFSVDCDQANDGTGNWLIVKEAP
jgi:hypothetical protein